MRKLYMYTCLAVTKLRCKLRCDVLLQTIADMVVYNKSRREARSRLVARSWERPFLKFKVTALVHVSWYDVLARHRPC